MRVPRLFFDADFISGQPIPLPAESARYVGKVLRLPAGAALELFNGTGGSWAATLQFNNGVAAVVPQTFTADNVASPLNVTLLQAIGRGERMDYAIQKAVELGVTTIQPLFTERTVVKLDGARLEKRLQHWQAIAASACEQCGLNIVPAVLPAVRFEKALALSVDLKLVLGPAANKTLQQKVRPQSVALLIGPEGGLSAAELDIAEAEGWQPWQLGPRVLRTETAGSAALAVLQSTWGDF